MNLQIAFLSFALAASATPAIAEPNPVQRHQPSPATDTCGGDAGQGRCRPILVQSQDEQSNRPVDCHRDVRTHRVNGVMLRHRHVGPNCQIREVRQSS
ncbi:hypothetical protein [Aminobacter sp. HY435]|uniref:hypothetical protein n=1 Tax=Aminobacter sp. HY435 TaxID=2970917 RepID=UPI0022B9571C|nr:hypothetical protein [Aminobacter sp. HY435]